MAQLSVAQKADVIGTFRFVSVFMMETLARWTPLTPELEAKVLFGRHLWEFAQHADALGQRTSELRAGVHYTRRPLDQYCAALDAVAGVTASGDRVGSAYDVMIPDLARRYDAVLADADPILDQPTIRIMDRIVQDLSRLQSERREMLSEVSLVPDQTRLSDIGQRLAACTEFVDYKPSKEAKS